MALSLVQHISAQILTSSATLDVTFASGTTFGSLIVVAVLNGNNAGGTNPTGVAWSDGTKPFTFAAGSRGTNGADKTECWYLPSAPSGKTVVRVTWPSATATDKQAVIFEVTGFLSDPFPFIASGVTGASSGSPLGPAARSNPVPSFIVGEIITVGSGVTSNPAAGNEFTTGGDITTQLNAACSLITSEGKSHQPQWTTSVATFCASTVVFQAWRASFVAPPRPPRAFRPGIAR